MKYLAFLAALPILSSAFVINAQITSDSAELSSLSEQDSQRFLGDSVDAPATVKAVENSTYSGYKGPGVYVFINLKAGSCMDLYAGSKSDGAKVAGWPCSAGKLGTAYQRWHILEAGDGTVVIQSNHTGSYLGATTRDGEVKAFITNPWPQHVRWKMDDQAYRGSFDNYPIRFINQETCQALNQWNGEEKGLEKTWDPDAKWIQQGWYLQLVDDTRLPCGACKPTSSSAQLGGQVQDL